MISRFAGLLLASFQIAMVIGATPETNVVLAQWDLDDNQMIIDRVNYESGLKLGSMCEVIFRTEKNEYGTDVWMKIMRDCREARTDPYLAMPDHRNTPSQGMMSSPARRLISRRTEAMLPTAPAPPKPRVVDLKYIRRDIRRGQAIQAEHANKKSSILPPLEEGDTVRLEPFKLGFKTWTKGTVMERLDERSYTVETPSGILRRNRQHLKKTNESNTREEESVRRGTSETAPIIKPRSPMVEPATPPESAQHESTETPGLL